MKRLSQRELLHESFADTVGNIAGGVAKTIYKSSPELQRSSKYFGDVISNFKFDSPKKYIESWKKQFPDVISDIQQIQIQSKGSKDAPLYIANFNLELRDPNTHDPVDTWIPVGGIPIKEDKDKEGNKQFKLAGSNKNIDDIMQDLFSRNPDTKAALVEFHDKVLNGLSREVDAEKTAGDASQPDRVTTSNFKQKLQEFKTTELQIPEPGIGFSELAVNQFVRKLAKEAGNNKWRKDLSRKIERIKSHGSGDWTDQELVKLTDLLRIDSILQESQKSLLKQLQLLSS